MIAAGLSGRDADGSTSGVPASGTVTVTPRRVRGPATAARRGFPAARSVLRAGGLVDGPGRPDVAALAAQARWWAGGWTRDRLLGPTSVCGISMALALCSAGWFTAGTRAGNVRAAAALWASYLAMTGARQMAGRAVAPAQSARTGVTVTGRPAAAHPASDRWLALLAWSAAEYAVYAGLAAGAAHRWGRAWLLATAVAGLVAVLDLMTALRRTAGSQVRAGTGGSQVRAGAVGRGDPGRPGAAGPGGAADYGPLRRTAGRLVTMPPGCRVLVIGVGAVGWGSHASLLAVLECALGAIGCSLLAQARGPGLAAAAIRSRDDGVLARWLGSLVRGNLLPFPPAALGLAATMVLACLGLGRLPAILVLSPALVMLLAAPGSGNQHAGRLDWLVPPVLLGWQVLYLAAAGAAGAVPGPATFTLCAVLALRYADLACPGRPVPASTGPARQPGAALGWEGRMLLAGAAAASGAGMLAYLALAAYLGVLVCVRIAASCRGEGYGR